MAAMKMLFLLYSVNNYILCMLMASNVHAVALPMYLGTWMIVKAIWMHPMKICIFCGPKMSNTERKKHAKKLNNFLFLMFCHKCPKKPFGGLQWPKFAHFGGQTICRILLPIQKPYKCIHVFCITFLPSGKAVLVVLCYCNHHIIIIPVSALCYWYHHIIAIIHVSMLCYWYHHIIATIPACHFWQQIIAIIPLQISTDMMAILWWWW